MTSPLDASFLLCRPISGSWSARNTHSIENTLISESCTIEPTILSHILAIVVWNNKLRFAFYSRTSFDGRPLYNCTLQISRLSIDDVRRSFGRNAPNKDRPFERWINFGKFAQIAFFYVGYLAFSYSQRSLDERKLNWRCLHRQFTTNDDDDQFLMWIYRLQRYNSTMAESVTFVLCNASPSMSNRWKVDAKWARRALIKVTACLWLCNCREKKLSNCIEKNGRKYSDARANYGCI